MSRVLIAGGGTAGHVVPALALADVLSDRGYEVAFCGTERGMEKQLVPRAGYSFTVIHIRGFTRRFGFSTLRTLGSIPVAAVDAWRLLRAVRPDCVVGVGAYASGPVVAEAALRGIPAVAVEMDSHMGWTNRILSRIVDKVCLSFPDPERMGDKYVFTGRPLRPALFSATREQGIMRFGLDPDRLVLLVFGGSLGSRTLNEATLGAFANIPTSFQILHVTGEREYARVADALAGSGTNASYYAFAFLDDFPLALAAADAVVARAGGSVAEVLARGVPSLLVPYPLAAGDHQTENARMVADAGAALTMRDADLNAGSLSEAVARLLDPEENTRMKKAALSLARPDAAVRIADVVVELVAASAKDHD
ncbi:MAG: undecaprenyldiphospho-muramoylpentapeptide beta-N-acetylglucosaminyltransferase [Actinobacteria bacterium RBG_16_64_13]|nr:MAG: undecaprenyldiphospho-muramoylpentapeptide beta-N-acetylglucosaminyltransferase [Actinobacteria bacterium RBG_16_64_13]